MNEDTLRNMAMPFLNTITWKSILTQLLTNLQKFQNYYSVIIHYCFPSTQSLVFCFSSPSELAHALSFSRYFCCGISLFVTLTPVPPSYMDSFNYIGPMWLIQENFPILKTLT